MSDVVSDLEFWLGHPDCAEGEVVKVPADVVRIAIAIIREHRRRDPIVAPIVPSTWIPTVPPPAIPHPSPVWYSGTFCGTDSR